MTEPRAEMKNRTGDRCRWLGYEIFKIILFQHGTTALEPRSCDIVDSVERVEYKTCLLIHLVLNGLAPSRISELFLPVSRLMSARPAVRYDFWATVTSNGSPYATGPLSCLSCL